MSSAFFNHFSNCGSAREKTVVLRDHISRSFTVSKHGPIFEKFHIHQAVFEVVFGLKSYLMQASMLTPVIEILVVNPEYDLICFYGIFGLCEFRNKNPKNPCPCEKYGDELVIDINKFMNEVHIAKEDNVSKTQEEKEVKPIFSIINTVTENVTTPQKPKAPVPKQEAPVPKQEAKPKPEVPAQTTIPESPAPKQVNKAAAPKAKQPKQVAAKQETPKVAQPKQVAAKQEAPKVTQPKQIAAKETKEKEVKEKEKETKEKEKEQDNDSGSKLTFADVFKASGVKWADLPVDEEDDSYLTTPLLSSNDKKTENSAWTKPVQENWNGGETVPTTTTIVSTTVPSQPSSVASTNKNHQNNHVEEKKYPNAHSSHNHNNSSEKPGYVVRKRLVCPGKKYPDIKKICTKTCTLRALKGEKVEPCDKAHFCHRNSAECKTLNCVFDHLCEFNAYACPEENCPYYHRFHERKCTKVPECPYSQCVYFHAYRDKVNDERGNEIKKERERELEKQKQK